MLKKLEAGKYYNMEGYTRLVIFVGKQHIIWEDGDGEEHTMSKNAALHAWDPLPKTPITKAYAYWQGDQLIFLNIPNMHLTDIHLDRAAELDIKITTESN